MEVLAANLYTPLCPCIGDQHAPCVNDLTISKYHVICICIMIMLMYVILFYVMCLTSASAPSCRMSTCYTILHDIK